MSRISVLKITPFALMILSSATVNASWSPPEAKWVDDFNRSTVLFPSGNVATVWGSIRRAPSMILEPKPTIQHFLVKGFRAPGAPARVSPLRFEGKPVRAPLVVFLTGLFGAIDDPVAASMISILQESGNHVVALPNPWSTSYQSAGPEALPGAIEDESQVILEVIKQVRKKLGPSRISTISLVGVSYGSFLATKTAEIDSRSSSPLIDGITSVLSPPLQFSDALKQMDLGIEGTKLQEEGCRALRDAYLAFRYFIARRESDLKRQERDCADYLLFGNFHNSLVELALQLHETRGIGTLPAAGAAREAWKRRLNFSSFIQEFLKPKEGQTLMNEQKFPSLSEIIASLPEEQRRSRYRILAAKDDFLNRMESWNDLKTSGLLPQDSILLMNWGGHFGYSALENFQSFAQKAFQGNYGCEDLDMPECLPIDADLPLIKRRK